MRLTQQQGKAHNGFPIPLQRKTELRLAMPIAEDEECHNEPIAVVGTIAEAEEASKSDFARRMRCLERGADPGLCPSTYKLWARGIDDDYCIVGIRLAHGALLLSRGYHARNIWIWTSLPLATLRVI
jgi:hypothetical protein